MKRRTFTLLLIGMFSVRRASQDWTDDFGRLSFSVAGSFGDFQFARVCCIGFRSEAVKVSDVGEVDIDLLLGIL